MKQILALTATKIGQKISTGRVCPIELTEAYIEEIQASPYSKSIFTTVMRDTAIKQANEAKIRAQNNNRKCNKGWHNITWKNPYD